MLKKALTVVVGVSLGTLLFMFGILAYRYAQNPPPKIQVNSLETSVLDVSATSGNITGNWNIGFLVVKKSTGTPALQLEVSLLYRNQLLSQARLPPFKLSPTYNLLNATAVFLGEHVGYDLAMAIEEKRAVSFGVDLVATEIFKGIGRWKRVGRYACRDIGVGFPSNNTNSMGTLLGGRTACHRRTKRSFFD